MNRTNLLSIIFIAIISVNYSYSQNRVEKSDNEWKKILSPIEYYVLRQKGTERPETGKYNKFYEEGIYYCAACDTPLFSSTTKYNSYSGWPAFYNFIKPNVRNIEDNSLHIKRTEIICAVCDGHLGHVFDDGPKNTTGKRYCVNSVSLKFKPKK